MTVLALIADLMTQSHVTAAGQRAGIPVEIAGTLSRAVDVARRTPPRLILVDLSNADVAVGEAVERLKRLAPAATIVAFGPHVHHDRLAAAKPQAATA